MKLKIVVHEEKDGGYWAEVPAVPGCASQGDTLNDLLRNVQEAVEACLSVDIGPKRRPDKRARVMEIAV